MGKIKFSEQYSLYSDDCIGRRKFSYRACTVMTVNVDENLVTELFQLMNHN